MTNTRAYVFVFWPRISVILSLVRKFLDSILCKFYRIDTCPSFLLVPGLPLCATVMLYRSSRAVHAPLACAS